MSKKLKPTQVNDYTGFPIPEHLLQVWIEGEQVRDSIKTICDLRGWLRGIEDGRIKSQIYAGFDPRNALVKLENIYQELMQLAPYAVCPMCQGQLQSQCACCKGKGYVGEFVWKTAIPAELKTLREKASK